MRRRPAASPRSKDRPSPNAGSTKTTCDRYHQCKPSWLANKAKTSPMITATAGPLSAHDATAQPFMRPEGTTETRIKRDSILTLTSLDIVRTMMCAISCRKKLPHNPATAWSNANNAHETSTTSWMTSAKVINASGRALTKSKIPDSWHASVTQRRKSPRPAFAGLTDRFLPRLAAPDSDARG